MSTRERWIVYPLLFLTLGIAMRDYFLPKKHLAVMQLNAGEIETAQMRCGDFQAGRAFCNQAESIRSSCRELFVTDSNGRPAIIAVADQQSKGGMLETFSTDGRPLVQLYSTEAGGIVLAFDRTGRVEFIGKTGRPPHGIAQPQHAQPENPSKNENTDQPAEKREK